MQDALEYMTQQLEPTWREYTLQAVDTEIEAVELCRELEFLRIERPSFAFDSYHIVDGGKFQVTLWQYR